MRKKIDIRHLAAALLAALMLLACLPVTQADAAGNTIHISSEAELRDLAASLFLIMGLVLIAYDIRDAENGVLVGIIFAPIGAFFMILGLTLRFAVPKTYNYENYKKRMEKYGYYVSTYDMYITVALQEERIAELEKKVKELEERL